MTAILMSFPAVTSLVLEDSGMISFRGAGWR